MCFLSSSCLRLFLSLNPSPTGNGRINDPDVALTNFLASSSSIDDQVSSGGEYISPTSVSIDQDEADETEIFSSPLPQQPPSHFPFVLSPSELVQQIRAKEGRGGEGEAWVFLVPSCPLNALENAGHFVYCWYADELGQLLHKWLSQWSLKDQGG